MRTRLLILSGVAFALTLACLWSLAEDDHATITPPELAHECGACSSTALSAQPLDSLAPAHLEPASRAKPAKSDAPPATEPRSLDRVPVRGRVLHRSGASLEGEPFRILAPVPQARFGHAVVTLQEDGSFAATIDVDVVAGRGEEDNEFAAWQDDQKLTEEEVWQALGSRTWGLAHAVDDYRWHGFFADSYIVSGEPRLSDGVVDLGDLWIESGLLEFRPTGILASGGIDYLIHLSGESDFTGRADFEGHPVRLLLPSGRCFYEWSPDIEDATDDENLIDEYRDVTMPGLCDVVRGQLTVVEVELPELEYVQVRVMSEDGPIEDAELTPYWNKLLDLHHGILIYSEPEVVDSRVLRTGRPNLSVHVSASGYESQSVKVPEGATELVVTLKKSEPGQSIQRQGVIVHCNLPESFTERGYVVLFGEDGRMLRSGIITNTSPRTTAYCDPGVWCVGIFGGGCNGYPGAMLSGLVEVKVAPNRYPTVQMPDPLPPPFVPARERVDLAFECATHDMFLRAPMRMPDGSVQLQDNPHDIGPLPLALVDGLTDIPLAFSEYQDGLFLGADLLARVRVTLSGNSVGTWATLNRSNGERALAGFRNGTACLWLPAGPAELEVACWGGTIATRTIEVPSSGTLEIDIESTSARVELVLRDDDLDWLLYRREESHWALCRGTWNDPTYTLPPGEYRAILNEPRMLGQRDFTVTAGRHMKIDLEVQQVFETGDVFMTLPPEFENVAIEGDIDVVTAQLAECMDGDIIYQSCWNELDWRYAPGGITLLDVPLGVELCLSGSIGRNETWYQLIPDVVRATADAPLISSPRWARQRDLGDHLSPRISSCTQWRAAGTLPRVRGSNPPVGEVTLYFTDQDHEEAVALTIPEGEGDFELPEAAAARLRELGWIIDD